MRALLLVAMLVMTGCFVSPDSSVTTMRTVYHNGVIAEKTETVVKAPKYSKDGSYMSSGTNGVEVVLGASQKAKDIIGAEGEGSGRKIVYIGLVLVFLLGAVALAMPNGIVSNKDAIIIMGSSGIGFLVVRYVEASAGIMGYVIPILVVVGIGYLFWQWKSSKK